MDQTLRAILSDYMVVSLQLNGQVAVSKDELEQLQAELARLREAANGPTVQPD